MSDTEDNLSIRSGTSVPSIGEDALDPLVKHLIVSEECCRAIYRSSNGMDYICPWTTSACLKRNHIRIRATNQGDPAIYEIHWGVRGGFYGVYSGRRLSPEDHSRLIQEARERSRANATVTAGAQLLGGA
jgi:hypothetical protein